jgi:DNA primase
VIPQSFISDLLARLDIVEVVGRHVQLKKAGANYQGLCPFHGEKTPSFSVSPAKQFYHCFGCQAHGTAIGFLMEHQSLSYVDAIKELARQQGLVVPEEQSGDGAPKRATPDVLESLALAAKFFKSRLKESEKAIDYLKRRGLSGQTAARFGMGYAPEGWRPLEAAVPDYHADSMVESGLVIAGDDDKRYDRFRDRVMFPIRNPRGQVIGFGGRVLDQGEPKYLNSPETPVFVKGRELYGLYEAREALRRENCAIVVEGYMDVVMLAQYGVDNALATLGTATTPDHLKKLLRQVDRVVFSFDGDGAGRKAAWRALEASLPMTSDTQRIDFLFLPPEHDPDSFVQAHGLDGWRAALAKSESISNFMLNKLATECDLAEPEGRAKLIALARPLLSKMSAPALRLQIVHRLSDLTQITVVELTPLLIESSGRSGASFGAYRSTGDGARGGAGGGQFQSERAGSGAGGPAWSGQKAQAGQGIQAWVGKKRGFGAPVAMNGMDSRTTLPKFSVRAGPPEIEQRLRFIAALSPSLPEQVLHDALEEGVISAEMREWLSLLASFHAQAGSDVTWVARAGNIAALEALAEFVAGAGTEAQRAWAKAMREDAFSNVGGVSSLGPTEIAAEGEEIRQRLMKVSQKAELVRLSRSIEPEDQARFRELLRQGKGGGGSGGNSGASDSASGSAKGGENGDARG